MVYEIDVSKGGIIRSKGSGKRRYCGLSNIFLAKKYRFTIKKTSVSYMHCLLFYITYY